jgi:hypothetical protein
MKIMNLVGRDRRSLKQRQSYMREDTLLCRPCRPIFTLHHPVVRGRTPERDSISVIVRPHSGERAASRHPPFEMEYVRWLQVRSRRLIVTAIFVQPWNRIRIGSAICSRLLAARFRRRNSRASHDGSSR